MAQLINAANLANPLAGFCNRCEHTYQLTAGSPSTTLTGAANTQGATTLTVASGTSLARTSAPVIRPHRAELAWLRTCGVVRT